MLTLTASFRRETFHVHTRARSPPAPAVLRSLRPPSASDWVGIPLEEALTMRALVGLAMVGTTWFPAGRWVVPAGKPSSAGLLVLQCLQHVESGGPAGGE